MESALLVPVPEADHVVGEWRQEHDAAARDGIAAHVTVLYPLPAPDGLAAGAIDVVRGIAAATAPFAMTFASFGWFGEEVLFLRPDDDRPIRRLTERVVEAFPAHPPYAGRFDDVIPHLTIGDDGAVEALKNAERSIGKSLPLRTSASELWWMQGVVGQQWHLAHRFPFKEPH